MCTRVTEVCLSDLTLAYDVRATNRTHQSGLCCTPKIFNKQTLLKSLLPPSCMYSLLFGTAKQSPIYNSQYPKLHVQG